MERVNTRNFRTNCVTLCSRFLFKCWTGLASLSWKEICLDTESTLIFSYVHRTSCDETLGSSEKCHLYLTEQVPSGVKRNYQLSQRPKRRHGYFSFLVTKYQTDHVGGAFILAQTILSVHFESVLLSLDRDKHMNRSTLSIFRQQRTDFGIPVILPHPDDAISIRATITEQNRTSNYHQIDKSLKHK